MKPAASIKDRLWGIIRPNGGRDGHGPDGPQALFAGRVLPFDERAALIWARLMAEGTAKGRLRSPLDMIIAAVAEANDCVVVTENEKDFAGVKIINPLRSR